MTDQEREKVCFVIAPIGGRGSPSRHRSDQILRHIIKPVAELFGYRLVRADLISEPGMITDQIINYLIEAELVVADLTERNPNVFYELAVRHAVRKPVISMIGVGESIPFDVNQSRTLQVDHHDLDSVDECKRGLEEQIRSLEKNPLNFFNPISNAIDLKALRESENPSEQREGRILTVLQSLQSEVSELDRRIADLAKSSSVTEMAGWRAGEWVRHPKFGQGEVMVAENGKVIVKFGAEERIFVPELAPLTKLTRDER